MTGLEEGKKEAWDKLRDIRSEVLSALETARDQKTIASSLEAKVTLVPKPSLAPEARQRLFDFLRTYLTQLPSLFIVSQVEISTGVIESAGSVTQTGPQSELVVVVHHADGKKCERCWNYSTHVGDNARYPTVCERCTEALAEIEGDDSARVAAS
ncbi:MAG TPA: zinc finger domain-containing protein [Candidatus Acidoferrum sp.]|nr:zinc finger domain-containing protein [Candidatus Acidoferrum sp.]